MVVEISQYILLGQKKIIELFEKDVFKVIIYKKVVIPKIIVILKEILSNTSIFNFCFMNKMKDLYIDKIYKKS